MRSNQFIKISGVDAENFLQGQLTCDVKQLAPRKPQLAALCNHQGRIIASLWISREANYFLLEMPDGMASLVMPILNKYAQFSQVALEYHDLNITNNNINKSPLDLIQNFIAVITPPTSGLFTPHDLDYQHIAGVIDFAKGCYRGQEIIARMHYRGKLKRHLYYIKLEEYQKKALLGLENSGNIQIVNIYQEHILAVMQENQENNDLKIWEIKRCYA